jgi:hypothetical protein
LQGFFPRTYRSSLASKYSALIKVFTVINLAVFVTSLLVFCCYGVLAQREGIKVAQNLSSQDANVSQLVSQLGRDAEFLEGVVNGTFPVSGKLINDTFVPEPPTLLQHSQVGLSILQDLYRTFDGSTVQTLNKLSSESF